LGRLEAWLRVEPRPVPAVRALRTTLRTAHLIAFAALYGGHVYGVTPDGLRPALLATLATGGALMGLEVYRAPVWLVQIRGLATFGKILLVASVALWWEARLALLTLVLVVGSVTSHMPSRWRYYSLVQGRTVGEEEKG
jgi:hypothetical protein